MRAGTAWLAMFLAASCLASTRFQRVNENDQQLRVSPDGRSLIHADGSAFFWLGDTAWSIFARLTREEAEIYLKDRASKGFTVVQMVAFGGPADRLGATNRYGDLPLFDKDPTRPNERYFQHVDWVIECARRYGLRVALLPTWGSNTVAGYGTEYIFTPESARTLGTWIGKRYRSKGIIWVLGGDTNPIWRQAPISRKDQPLVDYRPIYEAMAEGIIEGQGEDPLITYHPAPVTFPGMAPPRTSIYFRDAAWLDINMLQSSHYRNPIADTTPASWGLDYGMIGPYNYEYVAAEYRASPVRPVIDGEPRYEDLPVDVELDPIKIAKKGYWLAYDARNAAYHALFAGAAGHTYGHHTTWQFYDPERNKPVQGSRPGLSWQQALNAPGAGQMHHAKALMLSRPFLTRMPDQSIVVSESEEGESYVSAIRDRSGSYAMIYSPHGQPVTASLDRLSGSRAIGWWFDPRTGSVTRIVGTFDTNSSTRFMPPSSGPDNDWVLVLDDASRNYSAPGQAR